MIDNNLNSDVQLNETLTKMSNAIRSIYLVRHLPLKATKVCQLRTRDLLLKDKILVA